jgi:hypothetical protein
VLAPVLGAVLAALAALALQLGIPRRGEA